ncbi:hypothetical protein RGQ29_029416 [Quercus rubra]|uniref:Uncharacterized protein n=1 Tax=Quercus rubra TaxID=3512 RepID=A0AAN7IP00_QUERU|nr:hypothetical protein RGQ29_003391 [Quercus rubra]KAK4579742.1 hypothetical protein RGQ29_029416 [Quercus rubra]
MSWLSLRFKEMVTARKYILQEECNAQLHSASAAPCPAHNGLQSSKVIL